MCGIAGYAGVVDDKWIGPMVETLLHRGPDDGGIYRAEHDAVHLGMRRLAIVDIADGKQPMSCDDGAYAIVFNGEIFNAPELRRELETRGRKFSTDHSDTEVLLHLYALEGEQMVDRLNGMFAFVIHDVRRRVLFGARDHCGIKPLHYVSKEGKFAFASEIAALKVLPWIGGALDHQAIADYLSFQAVPAPRSIYAEISKLGAGCCFTYGLARGEFSMRQYWMPPVDRHMHSPMTGDHPEMLERLRTSFLEAVERWSLSDVPVGFSLSGGVDSPAIVGAAASRGYDVHTYTLGFDDAPALDEREEARTVAERWNTKHREIVLKAEDLLADLDAMTARLGEPYAGGLPSWFVFKAMAKDVKVAMTGTGGDELFGNYGKWLVRESRGKRWTRIKTFFKNGGRVRDLLSFPDGALHYSYFPDAAKRHLLLPEIRQGTRPSAALVQALWDASPDASARGRVAYADFHLQLPEEFLHMTDRFSMAHSLEARTPFLDREFLTTAFSIPPEVRTSPGSLKGLFVDAVGDLLPPALLNRRKKGFVLPTGKWLRGKLRPLVEELFSRDYLEAQGIFSPEIVPRYVRPHLEGQRDFAWQVWTLLGFQLWYEREVRGNSLRA